MSTSPPRPDPLAPLRRIGPLLLVAGSACATPLITVCVVRFTGDRLLGLAAVGALAVLLVTREVHWTSVHTALAVFVGVQIVTSALYAAVWPHGVRYAAVYVLGFACFALAAEWARGVDGQRRMASAWTNVGVLVSVVGTVACILANVYQRDFPGARIAHSVFQNPEQEWHLYEAIVTFGEGNLFSSFVLIPFVLGLWAWRGDGRDQRGLIAVVAVLVLGLVAGVTRAAWVAVMGIVVAWCIMRPLNRRLAGMLGLMLALVLLVQALALGGTPLHTRLVGVWTVLPRGIIARATVASWPDRPLLGHGAGSSNFLLVDLPGLDPAMKIWNSNLFLFVLRDSGLLGLTALLAVFVLILRRAVQALRRDAGRTTPSLTVPLLVAGIALGFCYQFTHALWLMYPYVYFGFLTAATERGPAEAGTEASEIAVRS